MKSAWLFLLFPVYASGITVDQYLHQVRTGSHNGRSLSESIASAELKMVQAEATITPELYGEAGITDDQSEKLVPFMGRRTEGHGWRLGVRKQFTTGTQTNLYYDSRWANLTGAAGIPQPNYWENRATLELVQPIWRNGFGAETKAQVDLDRARLKAAVFEVKYQMKKLMMDAENTYWSLVAYNQMIQLQQENVERSRKSRDLMKNKAGLRLVDDVDYLQTQAAMETRELELQTSTDERNTLIRNFNLLRGVQSEDAEGLESLPEKVLTTKFKGGGKVTREDYDQLRQIIEASRASARGGRSHVQPQLDLVGSFSANGMNPRSSTAHEEVTKNEHETWMVGVRFSAPLDYNLMGKMAHAFRAQQRAAVEGGANLEFSLERGYAQLVSQHGEAQHRYEKAANLEKITTQLVKRERQRRLDGRSTIFQSLAMETNLAASQIQKVQALLALVRIHNVLKTFQETP